MDFRVIVLFSMAAVFVVFWLLVLSKGPRQILTRIYSIFIVNMALWSFGLGMFYTAGDPKISLFWSDFLYLEGNRYYPQLPQKHPEDKGKPDAPAGGIL